MDRSVRMWLGFLFTCLYWVSAASSPAQHNGVNTLMISLMKPLNISVRQLWLERPFCRECGQSKVDSSKIVGGLPASVGEYPWMAYLGMGCGGTLIKKQWVLTAAHCYYKLKNPKRYTITLGKTNIASNPSGSLTLKPIKIIIHKKYNPSTFANDIALLKLPYALTFTDTIKPLCVARGKDIPFGKTAVATGWGVTDFDSIDAPTKLREVTLDVISKKQCRILGRAKPKFFICGLTKNKDTCQGDSGGPLMVEVEPGRWAQVGIVSHGEGCAMENSPGVYTKVPAYISWIAAKTGSKSC